MIFYVDKPVPKDRVLVGLEDNDAGEVSVTLNGVQHLSFSSDGDVVFSVVHDEDKVAGIKYNHNELAIWGGK